MGSDGDTRDMLTDLWMCYGDWINAYEDDRPPSDDWEFIGSGQLNLEYRSEEHTSELQSLRHLVCRLLLEKKKKKKNNKKNKKNKSNRPDNGKTNRSNLSKNDS